MSRALVRKYQKVFSEHIVIQVLTKVNGDEVIYFKDRDPITVPYLAEDILKEVYDED